MIFGQAAGLDDAGGATARSTADGPDRRARGGALALGLIAVWSGLALLTLSAGALSMTLHETDATHLAAIVLRMADGEWPHLDFMTPIGIGALAPIAALVAGGAGLGHAFILAQALVAAALLPALWWVGATRLGGGWIAWAFGAFVLALTMAAIHGGDSPGVSVSMHYNRWAWAVTYVLLALSVLPGPRAAPRVEGAMIGVGLGWLALTKVTYFAGLAPVALLALALRGEGRTLLWAAGAGLTLAAGLTVAAGMAFWPAYLGDLLDVAASDYRTAPGLSVTQVLTAPGHLAGTLALIAAILILRRSGRAREGAILFGAVPGLTLITWQNAGNDPQWLPFLALALLALRPQGPSGQPHVAAALVAGALALPSALNVIASPARLAAAAADSSVPLLPARPVHADYRIVDALADEVLVTVPSPGFARPSTPAFWGETLPVCEMRRGGARTNAAMADELAAAGFAGRRAFVADVEQALWLFGDFERLPGGAPWYYGGLPGAAAAEIVVVPLCPLRVAVRDGALAALQATGWRVTEVFRGRHAAVLDLDRG